MAVDESKALAIFQPLSALERLDDEIILAELQGEIVKEWVYRIPAKGDRPEIIDLSKVGVDECVSAMAHKGEALREIDVAWTVEGDYYNFVATVGRYVVNAEGQEVLLDTFKGFKRQWTKMRLKSGQVSDDEHFFEKGGIKAVRNAKKRGITQAIRAAIIDQAKKAGKVRVVTEEEVKQPEYLTPEVQGYVSWIVSCPIHKVAWEQGSYGKFHRVAEGAACNLNAILSDEVIKLREQMGWTTQNFHTLIKRDYGMPFSSLKYTDKVKVLEYIAGHPAKKE